MVKIRRTESIFYTAIPLNHIPVDLKLCRVTPLSHLVMSDGPLVGKFYSMQPMTLVMKIAFQHIYLVGAVGSDAV